MTAYALLKTVHIISSTVLFGLGAGTAFHMLATHLRGDVRAIASTARNVVLADWLFTSTSGVVQPASGLALVWLMGYPPLSSWLVATYLLYVLAGACWVPVVALQMRMERLATAAARSAGVPQGLPNLVLARLARLPGTRGRVLAHGGQARPLVTGRNPGQPRAVTDRQCSGRTT